MANPNILAGVQSLLIASPKVTALLGTLTTGGAAIVAGGRLSQGFTTSLTLPAIVMNQAETPGTARSMPFRETRIHLMAYGEAQGEGIINYVRLRNIIEESINAIHRHVISVQMSYYTSFEVYFDDYISRDLWDTYLALPYITARFCVYGVNSLYGPVAYP